MLVYVFGLVLVSHFRESDQHGYLEKPPQRSSLWRYGYDTPPNYTDNELYCGGIDALKLAEGKCGPCGDPYIGVRQHEAGGKFASGIIVEKLPFGAKELDTIVKVSSHHMGYFTFHICVHNDLKSPVTQECLDKTPLRIKEGSPEYDYFRYYPEEPWNRKDGDRYKLKVLLPPEIICSQCVLQWTYITGNSWGTNKDGASCLGCGIQEEFRNCADISIGEPDVPSEKDVKPNFKNSIIDAPHKQIQDVDIYVPSRDTVTEVPRQHTLIPPSFLKNKFEIEKKLLERFRLRQAASIKKAHSFTQGTKVNRFSAANLLRTVNERPRKRITTTTDTVFSWVDNKFKISSEPSKYSILNEGFQLRRKPEINLSKPAKFHRENGDILSMYSSKLEGSNGERLNKLYPGFQNMPGKEFINASPPPSWASNVSTRKDTTDVLQRPKMLRQSPQKRPKIKSNISTSQALHAQVLPQIKIERQKQFRTFVKSTESMPRYSAMNNEQNVILETEFNPITPEVSNKDTNSVQVQELQMSKPGQERIPPSGKYRIFRANKPIVAGENGINFPSRPKFVFKNNLSKLASASKNQNKRQSWISKDISTPRFVFETSPQKRRKPITSTYSFISISSISNTKGSSSVTNLEKSRKKQNTTPTNAKLTTAPLARTEASPVIKTTILNERIMASPLRRKEETTASSKTNETVGFKNSTSEKAMESTTHSLKVNSTVTKVENSKAVKEKDDPSTSDVKQLIKEATTLTSPSPKLHFKEFPSLEAKFAPTFRYKGSRLNAISKAIPSSKPSRQLSTSRPKLSGFKSDQTFQSNGNISGQRSRTMTSIDGRPPLKGLEHDKTTVNKNKISQELQRNSRLSNSTYVGQQSDSKDNTSTISHVSTDLSLADQSIKPTTSPISSTIATSIQASVRPIRETVSFGARRIQDTNTSISAMSSAKKIASNLTPIVQNTLSGSKIAELPYMHDRMTVSRNTPDADVFVTNLSENKVTTSKEFKLKAIKDVYIEPAHQKQEIVDKKVEVRQIVKTRTTLPPTTIRQYMAEQNNGTKTKTKLKPKPKKAQHSKKRLTLRQMQEFQRRYNRALKVLEILKEKPKALLKHPMFAGHNISKSAVRKLIRKMEAAKKHIKRLLNNNIQLSL